MKTISAVLKVLSALAVVAGAVYAVATYGDQIVAWAKKLMAACPCKGSAEEVSCEEAPAEEACCCEEAPAEEACCCEEAPAEETCCCEEAPAEETCCEEAPAEDAAPVEPVADETDFEG